MNTATRLLCTALLLPACAAGVDGATPGSAGSAIVNGAATTIAEHPWQVSLQSQGYAFCGGSIIDASFILTAQHCVEGQSAGGIYVVAGVTNLSDSDSGQARNVAQIVRNPGFTSPENGHDGALLRLSQPLTLGGNVQAISRVSAADVAAGATDAGVIANVSGWGALSSSSQQTPDSLRDVDVPIRSMQEAQQFYGQLSSDQLAAGGDDGDSCQGDSGGPLTVPTSHGTALAGVVSWGSGCADGYPGLYARVSSFNDWIDGVLAGGSGGDDAGGAVDPSWMCDPAWFGDGECDCGCGAPDGDCPSASLSDCQYNECDTWQAQQGLEVDENDPSQCVGGTPPDAGGNGCPANASPTPDGTSCQCDDGFVPNPSLTACVSDASGGEGEGEGVGEGEGEGQAGIASDRDSPRASDDGETGGCNGSASAPPLCAALALTALMSRRRRPAAP